MIKIRQSRQRWSIFFFFIFFFLFFAIPTTFSQEYKTVYDAHYMPHLNGDSEVTFQIKIISLRSDRYVKELTLSFPKNFAISDLTARDDYGSIEPLQETQEQFLKVKLIFTNPNIGKNSENNFYLSFLQKNLFKTDGNIWEIILPTMNQKDNIVFNIKITLPENSDKQLTIAKPKPTNILGRVITWDDVKTRTVYAVFGKAQFYSLKLIYHLKNEELRRVYYDIALPPETLYQKLFINALKPAPEKVYLDEDDNLLARYTLNIAEQKNISFEGAVEVLAKPQDNLRKYFAKQFSRQKQYLLSPQKFWDISQSKKADSIKDLITVKAIYDHVVDKLTYDFDRFNGNKSRLGADQVLEKPDKAVCMEFTDLFIASARQNGFYAREMNGYGLSQDQNLRPLSLEKDILHAWPEYYDQKNDLWVSVDPTWENTSGIDYFSSFDVNHIVFAIHGKDSSYPNAAGTYKIDDNSKDVIVKPIAARPKEILAVKLDYDLKNNINNDQIYKGKATVKNVGNVYLVNSLLEVKSPTLNIKPNKINIEILAPYQTSEHIFQYDANKIKKKELAEVVFIFNDKSMTKAAIKITPFYRYLLIISAGVGIGFFICLIIYFYVKNRF